MIDFIKKSSTKPLQKRRTKNIRTLAADAVSRQPHSLLASVRASSTNPTPLVTRDLGPQFDRADIPTIEDETMFGNEFETEDTAARGSQATAPLVRTGRRDMDVDDSSQKSRSLSIVVKKIVVQKTMKAAFVTEFGKPLTIGELPVPEPQFGQVLIKIEACGVCHTDIHVSEGSWPGRPKLPFTPGHEGVGSVVALGRGVRQIKEGDRVGVPWLFQACGLCDYCLTSRENMCESALYGGYTASGGFAEYCVAPADYVARIPNGLSAINAGPIICAGVTAYKGIKVADCKAGDWLVISGVGGLGHLGIQYARAMGLRVVAVDIDEDKLALAKTLGAIHTFNAASANPVKSVQEAIGGAHGVLVTSVSESAFEQGTGMLRRGGTCVLNGLPAENYPLSILDTVFRCLTIRGSLVGTRADMKEALALAVEGKVKANVEIADLDDINEVLARLRAGKVSGRIVLKIA